MELEPVANGGVSPIVWKLGITTHIAFLLIVILGLPSVCAFQADAQSNVPKPAPDRHLRLNREEPAKSAGTTSVSLTGSVSRLGASGSTMEDAHRTPISGKVDYLIETPYQDRAPGSQSLPPEVFRGWLEDTHKEFSLQASRQSEEAIVVVKGQWDDSAKTLKKFEIPYLRVGSGKLEQMPLDGTRVVIVDCAGNISREACQKLRDFVARGGYLLSTDWALDNFTGPTFKNYIEWNKGVNRDDIYDATAYDVDPVLFTHTVRNASWKLDQASHLIRVLNHDAVRVLATSKKLIADDPDRKGILAVVFPFGRGYVLHMTGHFDNNSKMPLGNFLPDPAPGIRISLRQAIATNFIVAGLNQTPIPTRHRP